MANINLPQKPIFIALMTLAVTLVALFAVSVVMLNLPGEELQLLIYVMAGTGIVTTLTSYGFYRVGILQWLGSLRWLLMLIIVFTIAVILFNMWLMAQIIFSDSHYLSIVSTMLVFTGMTALSFSFFVSKAMTQRLSHLTHAAEQLAEGDLSTRLRVRGNDEIALLTDSFNMMAHNLQAVDEEKRRLERTRRDLVAWVSHDLRTPLTSMRVMMEALNDGIITDSDTQQRYLNSSLAEIEHLSHLIDDLFEMAQLDVGHLQLNLQPTSLHDLISDTIGSMLAKAERKNITLTGSVDNDIDLVMIAPDKIQRVLYNLVNNAITYTPENERISIQAYSIPNGVQIDVHNSGVQIPEDKLPQIFRSFYRGEQSRASQDGTRGTGLGLAIARGIVEAHGGKIWAHSTPEHGTTFCFNLPKLKSDTLTTYQRGVF